MALFNECMQSCALIVLDTADIVRDGDFSTVILDSRLCEPGQPQPKQRHYVHRAHLEEFVDRPCGGKRNLSVYGNGYWLIMQKQNSS